MVYNNISCNIQGSLQWSLHPEKPSVTIVSRVAFSDHCFSSLHTHDSLRLLWMWPQNLEVDDQYVWRHIQRGLQQSLAFFVFFRYGTGATSPLRITVSPSTVTVPPLLQSRPRAQLRPFISTLITPIRTQDFKSHGPPYQVGVWLRKEDFKPRGQQMRRSQNVTFCTGGKTRIQPMRSSTVDKMGVFHINLTSWIQIRSPFGPLWAEFIVYFEKIG